MKDEGEKYFRFSWSFHPSSFRFYPSGIQMRYLAFAGDRPAVRVMRRAADFANVHTARIVPFHDIEAVRAAVFDDAADVQAVMIV